MPPRNFGLRRLTSSAGYNIIHIVPNAGLDNKAFDFDELDKFLDIMDEIGLWLMFDMSQFEIPSEQHPIANTSSRVDIHCKLLFLNQSSIADVV